MAIDARGLKDPDQNRELPLALQLAQIHHLLIAQIADHDPSQFHLHEHGKTPERKDEVGRMKDERMKMKRPWPEFHPSSFCLHTSDYRR